jgi:hypothetical protein
MARCLAVSDALRTELGNKRKHVGISGPMGRLQFKNNHNDFAGRCIPLFPPWN